MNLDALLALGEESVEVSFEMPNGQTGTVRMKSPPYADRMALFESVPADGEDKDRSVSDAMSFNTRLLRLCLVESATEAQAGQLFMLSGGIKGPVFVKALSLLGNAPDGKDSGSENPSPSG